MSDERTNLEGNGEVLEEGADPQMESLVEEKAGSEKSDMVQSEQGEHDIVAQDQPASGHEAEPEPTPNTVEPVTDETEISQDAGSSMDFSDNFRSLTEGEVVDGIVVHIDKEGVLVDVGTKSEGIIRPDELSALPVGSAEDVVSVGDKIGVYVVQSENADGNPVLSKKRADFEDAWERVQEAYTDGRVLTAMVTDRVKGGLVVDLGIRGFVPGSHIGTGKTRNLERYVGQSLPFKVIEVDRERRKVVLSHRLAVEEDRRKQREETAKQLAEGQIRQGMVRRITDYGAFIDLGGIDGLLHVSEMSWTRVNHPSEVVKVGQKIQVMVLKLNLEAGRVSLGLRQILPDPWAEVPQQYSVGQVIEGNISRIVPFGAFVQLGVGIEGIIPNAELSHKRVKKPEDVVAVGDAVEAKILEIRLEERRMTLSIRHLQEDKEAKDYESYRSGARSDGNMTLGDLVGDKLSGLVLTDAEDSEQQEQAAETAVEETAPEVASAEPEADVAEETPAPEAPEQPSVETVEEAVEVEAVEEQAIEAEPETAEASAETETQETKAQEAETATSAEEEASEEASSEEENDKVEP